MFQGTNSLENTFYRRECIKVNSWLSDWFFVSFIHLSFVRIIRSFVTSSFHCFILHLFLHSFIHSFILSFVCSFIHPFIHSFIHSFIHPFIHSSFILSYMHSFIHFLTLSFTILFTVSFMHLFIISFILSPIMSFIHLFIHSFIPLLCLVHSWGHQFFSKIAPSLKVIYFISVLLHTSVSPKLVMVNLGIKLI